MKKLIVSIAALASTAVYSQVGVNNTDPKATMDITAKTTDGSKPEGLIVPRLTGDQIRLGNTSYTTAQTGAIIYSTSADSAPAGKTINITAPGYYYFDGSVWQKVITGSTGDTTNDAWVNDNGNTMVKIGTQSDGSTARVVGAEFIVKDNGDVGLGTSNPGNKLQVIASGARNGITLSNSTTAANTVTRLGIGGGIPTWGALNYTNIDNTIARVSLGTYEGLEYLSYDTAGPNKGNIGIGTTSAANPLTVSSGSTQYPKAINILETTYATSKRAALGIGSWQVLQDINADGTRNFSIFNGLSGGTNVLNITETNNVGIGVVNPTAKLELNSGVSGQSGLKFTSLTSSSPASPGTSKNLSVDNSGNVILSGPVPPNAADLGLFAATITSDRPTGTAGGSYTNVVYQAENVDAANAFSPTAGTFIVPTSGYYYFIGSVQFDNTVSGGNFTQCGMRIYRKDAANVLSTIAQQFITVTTKLNSLTASGLLYCLAGETVYMATLAYVDSGTTYSTAARTFQGWKISN
ncbi:hypothetical protein GCM10023210_10030 [Chryseobacterium ginsengisoli]|uniref:C1q domain-containing protein n=1 Tax=Chryseobacterium ginsengisoli TaxID=363853 RepID=A0ABP9LX74_9FLAO